MVVVVWGLMGCDALSPGEPEAPEIPERCRNIHVDRLAGDWTSVRGQAADPKVRMRISSTPGGYRASFIDGSFTRRVLDGTKRQEDVQFTEVPTPKRRASFEAGELTLTRLYVEPSLADCALKVYSGTLAAPDKETIPPTAIEFVPFPEQPGVRFSFQPADEPLFLGGAAQDPAVRDAQLQAGGPVAEAELGTVPVGTWSDATADGDPSCTYDMDLYFDDQLVGDLSPRPAGEVLEGRRRWFHEWEAPFSGNHHFEMFRYRTCPGSERQLIAVAGVDAVLM